jgi:hypothetical protein
MRIKCEPWVNPSFKGTVESIIRKWAFVIPKWVDQVIITSTNEQYVAQMSVKEEYRTCTLYLGCDWSSSFTVDDDEKIILHELCHLYTIPIARVAKEAIDHFFEEETPGTKIAKDTITRAMERCTEDLAIMLREKVYQDED